MYVVYGLLALPACAAILATIHWYRGRQRETDPFKLNIEQAAKLKWKQTGDIKQDGEGATWTRRSVRFVRGKEEAVLWHKGATISLVRLHVPFDFDDFIELEEFIARHPREPQLDDAAGERKCLREIELYAVRYGYRDDLLHIQATDYAFLAAFMKYFKAGYAAGEDYFVVAALLLDAVKIYGQDRERSLKWLTSLTEDFNSRSGPDV